MQSGKHYHLESYMINVANNDTRKHRQQKAQQ